MAGFFDPQQVSYSPMLEPAGFDMLRAFLMSQVFQRGANPYGLSQEGMQNMGDRPLVSNQPNMSRLSGFGYSPQGGSPPQGGMPPSGPSPGQGQPSRRPRSITRYDGTHPNRGNRDAARGGNGPSRGPSLGPLGPTPVGPGRSFTPGGQTFWQKGPFGGPKPPQFPSFKPSPVRMPAPVRTQPRMPDNPLAPRPIEPPGSLGGGHIGAGPGSFGGGGMHTQPGRAAGPSFATPPPVTDRMQNPLAQHLSGLMRQPSFQGRGF